MKTIQSPLIYHCSVYTGLCSSIGSGTALKRLFADDLILPLDAEFSRLTVKCRTLGTNTYIAVDAAGNYRFTAANQSQTWVAPNIRGTIAPFSVSNILVIGDTAGGAGILEITGTRVYRESGI